jgi:hypothetical protein
MIKSKKRNRRINFKIFISNLNLISKQKSNFKKENKLNGVNKNYKWEILIVPNTKPPSAKLRNALIWMSQLEVYVIK